METNQPSRVILERFINSMEAYLVYHFLDSRGLPVSISERPLQSAMGEIPFVEITTSIYLEDVSRFQEAQELIEHYRSGLPGVRGAAWTCTECGETHEPMFGSCWNCGGERP